MLQCLSASAICECYPMPELSTKRSKECNKGVEKCACNDNKNTHTHTESVQNVSRFSVCGNGLRRTRWCEVREWEREREGKKFVIKKNCLMEIGSKTIYYTIFYILIQFDWRPPNDAGCKSIIWFYFEKLLIYSGPFVSISMLFFMIFYYFLCSCFVQRPAEIQQMDMYNTNYFVHKSVANGNQMHVTILVASLSNVLFTHVIWIYKSNPRVKIMTI